MNRHDFAHTHMPSFHNFDLRTFLTTQHFPLPPGANKEVVSHVIKIFKEFLFYYNRYNLEWEQKHSIPGCNQWGTIK
jgi:hypothetical protein